MTSNAEIATLFEEYADYLEARDVEFKPRSYRVAGENVRDYPQPVEALAARGQDALTEIEGVGQSIAEKVIEYVETGTFQALEDERERMPVDMPSLTAVEGVGPKTVGDLYAALGIETLEDLEAAAEAGEIREVEGFGEKSEQNILAGIAFARQARERSLLGDARPRAEAVLDFLDGLDAVSRADVAGSLRRWRETIGDVDALAASESPAAVVAAFADWEAASDVIEAGENKASVRLEGVRVDLRVVVPGEFGSALQYFTGSKEHNIRLRNYAIDRGLKVNEYGVFDVSDVDDPDAGQRVGERIAGETEEEVYAALDLPWMAPELREDTGEIDAAARGTLPDLVSEDDVRGDLHVHTTDSDGSLSIREMARGGAEFGHEYLAISDHAEGPGVVGGMGLTDDELREQIAAVREADADSEVALLAGVEANVDRDGSVSVADDVLAALDVVVASPHTALDLDREAATDRLVAAVEHPHVDVLGHPHGRILNGRPGMDLDVTRLAEAAAENGVALEVNANPARLDLPGPAVRAATGAGAVVCVNTDAHGTAEYPNVAYGVHTARRGWAEADDVLNARDLEGLRDFLG